MAPGASQWSPVFVSAKFGPEVLAYQTARAVWPELAILDPIVGGLTLILVAHQAQPSAASHASSAEFLLQRPLS